MRTDGPYQRFTKNTRVEDRDGPQDGDIVALREAKCRWGQALIHRPMGGKAVYVEMADDGGVWRPIVLDFFGGVVGYRFHKD